MLTAPIRFSVLGLNKRTQLFWQWLDGAVSYNVYRNGTLLRNVPYNLWIDFGLPGGLTNGTVYSYTISGVDANGVEGAQSAPVSATPVQPTATEFRYRQALGYLLRYLVATDGLPAINAAFQADATAKSQASPLLTLTPAQVIRGTTYAQNDAAIMVDVTSQAVVARYSEGLSSLVFQSQVQIILPSVGSNRPEDRSFAGDVIMDTLHAQLGGAANALIPSLSPVTGNWMLPGCAVFKDCRPTEILRLSRPVVQEDRVTRVPAWILLHESTIEISQSDLQRTA